MNPLFDNWLKKNKGISAKELKVLSEDKRKALWEEYLKYQDGKCVEYNRQFKQDWEY